jgi:hypothetical protein
LARRKNSAEMLDVLRRMHQDERAKRAREAQKPELPPAAPPPSAERFQRGDETERGDHFESPSRIPLEPEVVAAPEAARPSFLAVLRGGRSGAAAGARTTPEAPLPIEARTAGLLPVGNGGAPRFKPEDLPVGASGDGVDAGGADAGGADAGGVDVGGAAGVHPEGSAPESRKGREAAAEVSVRRRRRKRGRSMSEKSRLEAREEAPEPPEAVLSASSGAAPSVGTLAQATLVAGAAEPVLEPFRMAAAAGEPAPSAQSAIPEAAASPPAGGSSAPEPARRPLFAASGETAGLRPILARALRGLSGGGLKKRVEVRLVTIALYAAVALLAMLVVAFFMNDRDRERQRENERVVNQTIEQGKEGEEPAKAAPLIENVPVPRGIAPEVRNVVEAEAGPPGAPGPEVKPAPPGAAGTTSSGSGRDPADGVWIGDRGPDGWYIQIQSMVSAEHSKLIIDHLKKIGYTSIWQRPNKVDHFIIRLGPYPSKPSAETEMERFKRLMKEQPLSKPRLKWTGPTGPFVLQPTKPLKANP